ncbi:uncharacterized protein LOC115218468 [Argonauta hians]
MKSVIQVLSIALILVLNQVVFGVLVIETEVPQDEFLDEEMKLIEILKRNRMNQINVMDTIPPGAQSSPGSVELADLSWEFGGMSCSWRGNIGKCCITSLPYIRQLCCYLTSVQHGFYVQPSLNGRRTGGQRLNVMQSRVFKMNSGRVKLSLNVVVVRGFRQKPMACFRVSYTSGTFRKLAALGCFSEPVDVEEINNVETFIEE